MAGPAEVGNEAGMHQPERTKVQMLQPLPEPRMDKGEGEVMPQYLLVRFDEEREVLIGGTSVGMTNFLIPLEEGTYTVTLAPPPDFSPLSHTIRLEDTAELAPRKIEFQRIKSEQT